MRLNVTTFLAWVALSVLTAALTIWTYYWVYAFIRDIKEAMSFGLPTTSVGIAIVILLVNFLRRPQKGTARPHGPTEKASTKPVIGGMLSIISGLLGGVVINPISLFLVFDGLVRSSTFLLVVASWTVCAIMAIVGGAFAVRRRRYLLAALGSMLAIPSLIVTGIPAFLLVVSSKNEFKDAIDMNALPVQSGV